MEPQLNGCQAMAAGERLPEGLSLCGRPMCVRRRLLDASNLRALSLPNCSSGRGFASAPSLDLCVLVPSACDTCWVWNSEVQIRQGETFQANRCCTLWDAVTIYQVNASSLWRMLQFFKSSRKKLSVWHLYCPSFTYITSLGFVGLAIDSLFTLLSEVTLWQSLGNVGFRLLWFPFIMHIKW